MIPLMGSEDIKGMVVFACTLCCGAGFVLREVWAGFWCLCFVVPWVVRSNCLGEVRPPIIPSCSTLRPYLRKGDGYKSGRGCMVRGRQRQLKDATSDRTKTFADAGFRKLCR